MHADERYSGGADTAGAQLSPPQQQVAPDAGADEPDERRSRRWWWNAAAWIGIIVALFAIFLRISNSFAMDSDAANNALQAWDMLHGNLLLSNWIIGDATYYTLELPLYAITESVLGLHTVVAHVVSSLTYVLLAVSAMLVARVGCRGSSAWIRSAIVVAVLAGPLLIYNGVSIAIEKPDHTGTAAITLLCFLLIDRLSGRLFMPIVLCLILVLGQVGDATVLYVTVPAIVLVSLYRLIFRWRFGLKARLKLPDLLTLVAAGASVPLAKLAYAGLEHLGGFSMIPPNNGVATSWTEIQHNLVLTGRSLRIVFGAFSPSCFHPGCSAIIGRPGSPLGAIGLGFGWLCLAAAAYGFGKVIVTWHRASRADQMVCVAIIANVGAYVFSTIPVLSNARELIGVVPCGAVLAARALVPERIRRVTWVWVLSAVAAVAVVLPLAAEATSPTAVGTENPLAAWLEAHGLKYGIAGYWNASAVTLQSGGAVEVRAVRAHYFGIVGYPWETKTSWYNPAQNYANFIIASAPGPVTDTAIPVATAERHLGMPAAIYQVAGQFVMVYHLNLLDEISMPTTSQTVPPPLHPFIYHRPGRPRRDDHHDHRR
jgi:hypothetical protein